MAENGSTDGTWRVVEAVAREFAGTGRLEVTAQHRAAASRADIVSYLDVDLSTDLADYPRLLAPLLAGEADVVEAVAVGGERRADERPDCGAAPRHVDFAAQAGGGTHPS